jgi:serine/threonine protein kinase
MFNSKQPAYESLRNIVAERTNGVVFWIGSGLSRPAGVPTWPELKASLCQGFENKIATLDIREQQDRRDLLTNIRNEVNPWIAFKMLQEALGETTYTSSIRTLLSAADKKDVPQTHAKLWRLQPAGVISLNLDRLIARSHAECSPGSPLNEMVGKRIHTSLHFLKSPKPFVAYMHGQLEDKETWVFTYDEMSRLVRQHGYKDFLVSCLASRTVVFVGISADDVAAGGHLARLSEKKIDTGHHFWITSRRDAATDRWAESAGIQVIRYATPGDSHAELDELLDDLASFVPQEQQAGPVFSTAVKAEEKTLSPTDLLKQDHETARRHLNGYAQKILQSSPPELAYKVYGDFCKEYEAAIHHAWFVTTAEPSNVLCGYRVVEEIAEGAFGIVYRATRPDETAVAIKVLHERVRKQAEMLQSFRRGVNSMKILSRHGVQGMVPYLDASEIPAFVVMECVEGPNLSEAVRRHMADDWNTILWIACEVVTIIRKSHMLPERVLHRDIKPSNIMIRGGWQDREDWKIVVLDFDLSWHKDATEASVLHFSSASGFLAPEQVRRTPSASTRSAAVDSFGIGMTLYFLRTGEEPFPSQHQHRNWPSDLEAHANRLSDNRWRSLSNRYFRLIRSATRNEQMNRWDVSQIEGELLRLKEAYQNAKSVKSAELSAEEIAARSVGMEYEWSDDRNEATRRYFNNLVLAVQGSESKGEVTLSIRWVADGTSPHAKVTKWLRTAGPKLVSLLKKGGWHVPNFSAASQTIDVAATLSVSSIVADPDKAVKAVEESVAELSNRKIV